MNRTYSIWSTSALFLLPALCMVLRSGYAYGCSILILASVFHIKVWREHRIMPKHGWLLYGSFVYIALVWFLSDWLSSRGARSFDYPIRILFTLPCMWYLLVSKPKADWLWRGIAVGLVASFIYAAYQFFVLKTRASAAISIIHFGDFALMFACMALCAWNWPTKKPKLWRTGIFVVFIMGLLASVFSGTRGAWLAFLLLVVVYCGYSLFTRKIMFKHFFAGMLACCLTLYSLYAIPQLHLGERVREAHDEVVLYIKEGKANTSVGSRLQMWEFAWDLYKKKPMFGWTYRGYILEQEQRVAEKKMDPMMLLMYHPHNELLNLAAKTGTLGIIAMLSVYCVSFLTFLRWFKNGFGNLRLRALSSAGMLMPLVCFGFGLVDAFFAHTSTATVYCYMLILLWGACIAEESKINGLTAEAISIEKQLGKR